MAQNERGIARWYEALETVQDDVRAALAQVAEAERRVNAAHSRLSVFDQECLNAAYELETLRPWESSKQRRRGTSEAYALAGTT